MKYYNWYETRNHLWIIFEYCSGGDLLTLIEQDKKLPESLVRNLIRDLTSGFKENINITNKNTYFIFLILK